MLCVAMRRVCREQNVRLLCSSRHSCRWPCALDVDQNCRDFGKVSQPETLVHQTDTWSARRGECTGAVPGCSHYHSDRSELVLGLNDRVVVLSGLGVDSILRAILRERIDDRCRRRDRIPRGDRRTSVDRTERARRVSAVQNFVAKNIATLDAYVERAIEILACVSHTDVQGFDVRLGKLFFPLEMWDDQSLENCEIQIAERRQCTDVDDVLEELTLACVSELRIAEVHQRNVDVS